MLIASPSHRPLLVVYWLQTLTLVAVLTASDRVAARRDGAPYSGCDGCHNGGQGPVELELIASGTLESSTTVELTLVVRAPNLGSAGFFATSEGVGTFAAGPGTQADAMGLTHRSPATASGDEARFQFSWTPPAGAGGVDILTFVVAANGDDRSGGDLPERAMFGLAWGCADPITVYFDGDDDGYGDDQGRTSVTCAERSGWSEIAGDCDDFRGTVYPDAPERCNERDDNCNGEVDEDVTFAEYYVDSDGDGYGDPNAESVIDCIQREGYAAARTDCDDTNPSTYPDAEEICDYLDNNCDDRIDNGARARCGTGWCERLATSCDSNDCVPGAPVPETCNGLDDDCDGAVDNGDVCSTGEACFEGGCIPAEDAEAMSDTVQPVEDAEPGMPPDEPLEPPDEPLDEGLSTPDETSAAPNDVGHSGGPNGSGSTKTSDSTTTTPEQEPERSGDAEAPQRLAGSEPGTVLDEQPVEPPNGCAVSNTPQPLQLASWGGMTLALALFFRRRCHRRQMSEH